MVDYFAKQGMPMQPAKVTREHVEMFLAEFASMGHKPATVQTRYKCRGCSLPVPTRGRGYSSPPYGEHEAAVISDTRAGARQQQVNVFAEDS